MSLPPQIKNDLTSCDQCINDSFELTLEEYRQVKNELSEQIKQSNLIERLALISSASIYVWYAKNSNNLPTWTIYVPLLITFCLLLNYVTCHIHVLRCSRYLLKIEGEYFKSIDLGWEKFIRKNPSFMNRFVRYLFWITLLVFNIYVIIYINDGI